MTRVTFPRAGTRPKHLSSWRLTAPPRRLGRIPRGYPATWLVAGAAGAVAAVVGGSANLTVAGDGLTKQSNLRQW